MLEYQFFVLICLSKSNIFDFDNPITVYPDPENIGKDSLFGYEVLFSKNKKLFYVGAPRALKSKTLLDEVGSVYKCPINISTPCSKRILPDKALTLNAKLQIMPLFGISFIEISSDIMIICSPNMPFLDIRYFCAEYNTTADSILGNFFPVPKSILNVLIENYGMQVDALSKPINNNTPYLFSQHNTIYDSVFEPFTQQKDLLISGSARVSKSVIKVRNIPGNKILINHNDKKNFLIVPYPDTNYLLGAFDVFNDKYTLTQEVLNKVGTYGQQFGFSGAFGKFNDDDCDDIMFSAPLYSERLDQGGLMVFYCYKETKNFLETPQLILGENVALARFGLSVNNIQDRNYDGIDDIAVLAPFWLTKNPVIYIYISTSSGFQENYYTKIELRDSQDFSANIAFKLISNLDIDDDGTNDIVVTYPVQNRFDYYMGVKMIELNGNLAFKTSGDLDSSIQYIEIISDKRLMMCSLTVKISFNVLHMTSEGIAQKPVIKYKVNLSGRENSYFNMLKYPDVIEGEKGILHIDQPTEVDLNILYWYYPIQNLMTIPFKITAFIDKNHKTCHYKCLSSQKISFTTQVMPPELICDSDKCLPQIFIDYEPFNQIFELGGLNERIINFVVSYKESAKSYYPKIFLTIPDNVKVVSSRFENKEDFIQSLEINSNKTITYSFTVNLEFLSSNKLRFEAHIEFIPILDQESFELIFFVTDAMYPKPYSIPKIITMQKKELVLSLTGISNPNVVNILKRKDEGYKDKDTAMSYNLQILNSQKYVSIEEAFFMIELPLLFESTQVFDALIINVDPVLEKVNCENTKFNNCGENTVTFYVKSIESNKLLKMNITLVQNSKTEVLIDRNISKIEMRFIAKYMSHNKEFEDEIRVFTLLKHHLIQSNKKIITAICIAVICSLVIIGITGGLAYKFNLAQKIKDHFSIQGEEKIDIQFKIQ